ncbi:galactose-specific lectin nattectin-like [Gigantopelta aegis]|uniref:galactose-specific lectin nattectin-like n=1 Tax=Gigantopelta aegis TaxID=1735272 RepID=UPI001B88E6D3|nr:galactose-specific lectin nattectin-like [Gigantopelta aegis]
MSWLSVNVLFALAVGALAQCPLYWTPHEESCYIIPQLMQTWTASMSLCQFYGGYLAEVTSQSENNFIVQFIEQSHVKESQLWIGGSDMLAEGHWTWTDRGDLLQYQPWASNEPDDLAGQHCLAVSEHGEWDDDTCSAHRHGVCEKK